MKQALILLAVLAGCADGVPTTPQTIDIRSPALISGSAGVTHYGLMHDPDYRVVCRPTCDAMLTIDGEYGSVQYLQAGVMRVFNVPGPAETMTIEWLTPGEIRIYQTTAPRQAGGPTQLTES